MRFGFMMEALILAFVLGLAAYYASHEQPATASDLGYLAIGIVLGYASVHTWYRDRGKNDRAD